MTTALEYCLHWVREREFVRGKKEAGVLYPWTKDEIISSYRFCNVRREDDRVTVWVRENIREQYAEHPYLWFMLCCARQINWPETMDSLIKQYPCSWPAAYDGFTPKRMGLALQDVADKGRKVFTGAYNITAPPVKGAKKTTWVAEHTLGKLWEARDYFGDLFTKQTVPSGRRLGLRYVHSQIVKFDCWGPFMAYQAVVDMRFCPSLLANAPDVDEWAAAGPGTIRGLNRIAGRRLDAPLSQDAACAEMRKLAPIIREETGVEFDFSDVPNIMCETDKYIRVKNGEGKPRAGYVPGRGS